jgi:hypothetical protein
MMQVIVIIIFIIIIIIIISIIIVIVYVTIRLDEASWISEINKHFNVRHVSVTPEMTASNLMLGFIWFHIPSSRQRGIFPITGQTSACCHVDKSMAAGIKLATNSN